MHKKTRKARQEKYLLAKKRKHVAPEKKRGIQDIIRANQ